jgi:hypothetical protein
MPREITAERTAEVQLDWLTELNPENERASRFRRDYSKVTIPAGSSVFMDERGPRFRMKTPDGKITAWKGFTNLTVDPGQYWGIKWRQPKQVYDPDFGFSMEDGKLGILLENMEGKESLFSEFVSMFSDHDMCPGGFSVPDGRYESNMLVDFVVTWGGNGVQPSLVPVPETLAAQPDIPSETLVEFRAGAEVNCRKAKQVMKPRRELYLAEVRSWNPQTGEVHEIRFSLPGSPGEQFKIDGDEFARLVAASDARVIEILQDRKRLY